MTPNNATRVGAAIAEAKRALNQCTIPLDVDVRLVGSTYIKDTESSDIDLLVTSALDANSLRFDGWEYGGSTPKSGDGWCSWKKTITVDATPVEVNLLVCEDRAYIKSWLDAAEVCRFLSLAGVTLTRGQIHGVHAIIMDDHAAEGELTLRNYD